MKRLNNSERKHFRTAFLVSSILHLLALVIFAIVKFGDFLISQPEYSTIKFSETPLITQSKTVKKVKNFSVKGKSIEKIIQQKPVTSADTLTKLKDTVKIILPEPVSNEQYLEFAKTLLDTFLIRNPQYATMVLKQQAKALAYKNFSRETLIKKINDELHKYIRKNFPEGSEHELNPYTGPGIQIPIDDVINLVKKIFQ